MVFIIYFDVVAAGAAAGAAAGVTVSDFVAEDAFDVAADAVEPCL